VLTALTRFVGSPYQLKGTDPRLRSPASSTLALVRATCALGAFSAVRLCPVAARWYRRDAGNIRWTSRPVKRL